LLYQQQTHADKLSVFNQQGMGLHYGTEITLGVMAQTWSHGTEDWKDASEDAKSVVPNLFCSKIYFSSSHSSGIY